MIQRFKRVTWRQIQCAVFLGGGLCALSRAESPDQTVHWSASVISTAAVKQGSKATLELSGEVLDGWHVYALSQRPGGPTALRVTLDENEVAQAAGTPSGTPPQKKHDPSFGLETQSYIQSFTVHLPVYVKRPGAAGRQSIPLSVRFQSCSDRECLPPATVHLSVSIDVAPGE